MSQVKLKFRVQHFDRKRAAQTKRADLARQQQRRAVGRGVLPECPAEDPQEVAA
ncbi:MAG: hypothetical protein WC683_13160 [bacterium]